MKKTDRHLPLSLGIAVAIHVAALGLLVVGYQASHKILPVPNVVINTVKAKVVDAEELDEIKRRRQEELQRQEQKRKQRLAEEKRRKQLEEEKRARAKREAEKARRAKLEAEKAKKRAALEKKKRAEKARKAAQAKKEAEARKLAEEKRRQQEKAAIDKQRLARLEKEEAEMRAAELDARRAQKARKMRRLIAQYQDAIRNKIERNWRRPMDYQSNAWCRVFVQQDAGGAIKNVVVEECIGSDAFRKSVENAVWKAAPLPQPPSPELFHQELRFTFDPRA